MEIFTSTETIDVVFEKNQYKFVFNNLSFLFKIVQ